jgi:hypothetical protein
MHKNATKCNETLSKWCKNKHGASKIIDTFEAYQLALKMSLKSKTSLRIPSPLASGMRDHLLIGRSYRKSLPRVRMP